MLQRTFHLAKGGIYRGLMLAVLLTMVAGVAAACGENELERAARMNGDYSSEQWGGGTCRFIRSMINDGYGALYVDPSDNELYYTRGYPPAGAKWTALPSEHARHCR